MNGASTRRFVLIHGNPSHLDHFRSTVPFLQRYGEVVAFDLPGFGRSEPCRAGPPTLDRLASVVLALADALGWAGALDLVGQSHGAAVAQTVAAQHPDRVQSLILLGTAGYPTHFSYRLLPLPVVGAVVDVASRLLRRDSFRPLGRAVAWATARMSFAPDPVPAGLVTREAAVFSRHPEVLRTMVQVARGEPSEQLRHQAENIRAPALFVHGADDQIVPLRHAQAIFDIVSRSSPASRFEVIAGGGHMMHIARHAEVHSVLERWFAAEDRGARREEPGC